MSVIRRPFISSGKVPEISTGSDSFDQQAHFLFVPDSSKPTKRFDSPKAIGKKKCNRDASDFWDSGCKGQPCGVGDVRLDCPHVGDHREVNRGLVVNDPYRTVRFR